MWVNSFQFTRIKAIINFGKTYLSYTQNGESCQVRVSKSLSVVVQIQPIITWFKIVIFCDLSFYSTATSRYGHSHVICPYCNLTTSEWSEKTKGGTKMILQLLCHLARLHQSNLKHDPKGFVMSPQLQREPNLLHLLIGLINKVWELL